MQEDGLKVGVTDDASYLLKVQHLGTMFLLKIYGDR